MDDDKKRTNTKRQDSKKTDRALSPLVNPMVEFVKLISSNAKKLNEVALKHQQRLDELEYLTRNVLVSLTARVGRVEDRLKQQRRKERRKP